MQINKTYLKHHQYQNANNLLARREIFKFRTNPESLWHWVARQYSVFANSKILEVGCGQGAFWLEAIKVIPTDCDITLTDFSPGMLESAKYNLKHTETCLNFEIADVENLKFSSQSFDIVFAHLMLYHTNDPETGLKEIKRVLKEKGFSGILLSSKNNMVSLFELLNCENPRQANRFSAEMAMEILPLYFKEIKYHVYESSLKVTEVEPIINYVKSLPMMDQKSNEFYLQAREILTNYIKTKGALIFEVPRYLFIVS